MIQQHYHVRVAIKKKGSLILLHDSPPAPPPPSPSVLPPKALFSGTMAEIKATSGADSGHEKEENVGAPLNQVPSISKAETGHIADINHVARLGMENTSELEKRIVRKLDIWMLPQLWILYMFNYLNRNNIAQARLSSLNEDLNLKDGDYQTAVAILTVGYMLAQLPSNMLITRVRPSIYLPAAAFIWSAISAMTVLCTSAGGLWGVQFILGIAEAPLFPGVCSNRCLLAVTC